MARGRPALPGADAGAWRVPHVPAHGQGAEPMRPTRPRGSRS
jgi:hypothetical protein